MMMMMRSEAAIIIMMMILTDTLGSLINRTIYEEDVFDVPTDRSTNTCNCGRSIYGTNSCNGVDNRIVGGQEARKNEFPWQAHVDICFPTTGCFTCGGTIIDYRYILLANHCVISSKTKEIGKPEYFKVKLGEHHRGTSTESLYYETINVEKVISYPGFTFETVDNDIALLKLSKSATFSRGVGPACLPSSSDSDYTGRSAVATGWGYSHEHAGFGNPVLQKANLRVLPNSNSICINGAQLHRVPPINKMCAYSVSSDTCQGDSGGPLVTVDHNRCTVIGVVSYGKGCARENHAGVYARVSQFLGWIRENTKDAYCINRNSSPSNKLMCDMTCVIGSKTGNYRFNGIYRAVCKNGHCHSRTNGADLCKQLNYPCQTEDQEEDSLKCTYNNQCDCSQVLSTVFYDPRQSRITNFKLAGVSVECDRVTKRCCDVNQPHRNLCTTLNQVLGGRFFT